MPFLGDILRDVLPDNGEEGADEVRVDPLDGAASSCPLETASSELLDPVLRTSVSGDSEVETMPLRRDWLTRFRTDAGSKLPPLD